MRFLLLMIHGCFEIVDWCEERLLVHALPCLLKLLSLFLCLLKVEFTVVVELTRKERDKLEYRSSHEQAACRKGGRAYLGL